MRVEESGDVVLPGRLLLDIVRALPAAGVTIAQPEALVPGCVARNTRLRVLGAREEFRGRVSNSAAAVRLGVHGGQRRSPETREARHAAVPDLVQ